MPEPTPQAARAAFPSLAAEAMADGVLRQPPNIVLRNMILHLKNPGYSAI